MGTTKGRNLAISREISYAFKDLGDKPRCPVCGKTPVIHFRDYVKRQVVFKHTALIKEPGRPGKVKKTTFCQVQF